MTDLFTYAATRRAAAEAIRPRAATLRQHCLREIERAGRDGLTADECAKRLDETVLAIRPRFTELRDAGQIVDSGARRTNDSGRSATVWISKQVKERTT